MTEPLPVDVVEAAVRVSGQAFHFYSSLKTVFLNAGVPQELWSAHALEASSKYVVARRILDALAASGDAGRKVQRDVVAQLASMSRPADKCPDPKAGLAAISELRRLATEHHVLVDPVALVRDQRRAETAAARAAADIRRERMELLRDQFTRLFSASGPDRQRRGYLLEQILVELFSLHDIEYRPPYRQPGQQVDGAFTYRAFTYLVEARWRANPPEPGDLLTFKGKIDTKLDSTRGLYVSVAGFRDDVVTNFITMVSGTRRNTVLVGGDDLMIVLEGRMTLTDALDYKIGKASEEGRLWAPLIGAL